MNHHEVKVITSRAEEEKQHTSRCPPCTEHRSHGLPVKSLELHFSFRYMDEPNSSSIILKRHSLQFCNCYFVQRVQTALAIDNGLRQDNPKRFSIHDLVLTENPNENRAYEETVKWCAFEIATF